MEYLCVRIVQILELYHIFNGFNTSLNVVILSYIFFMRLDRFLCIYF